MTQTKGETLANSIMKLDRREYQYAKQRENQSVQVQLAENFRDSFSRSFITESRVSLASLSRSLMAEEDSER